MADDLVSISGLAAETGVTKQAIHKAVKDYVAKGLLKTFRRGKEVVFSRADFMAAKNRLGDPAREMAIETAKGGAGPLFSPPAAGPAESVAKPPAEPSEPSEPSKPDEYRKAASLVKQVQAKKAYYELRQLEGSLLDRDSVASAQLTAARKVRNTVLAACNSAADRIAALTDPKDVRAVKALLQSMMKEALTALANDMPTYKGGPQPPPLDFGEEEVEQP